MLCLGCATIEYMNKRTYFTIGKALVITAGVLALMAGVFGIKNITGATDATKMVETWRVVGFFTFSALFFLLGTKLVRVYSLWLVVLLNKLALTVIGLAYGSSVNGAINSAAWDTTLTVLLLAGYLAVKASDAKEK